MKENLENNCIVCNNTLIHKALANSEESLVTHYSCPRCGDYIVPYKIEHKIKELDRNKKSTLSHIINKNLDSYEPYKVTTITLDSLEKITPFTQADNLILYLGKHQQTGIGTKINLDQDNKLYSELGILIYQPVVNFKYIVDELIKQDLINLCEEAQHNALRLKLTFKGWQKYEEKQHSINNSRKGFMAMKFQEEGLNPPYEELDKVYKTFKACVSKIGFDLSNPLLENPKSGSIDARIEREVRDARFVVAELSHNNQGAYWEAGLAHGLGKPVFYTCKEGIKTHFDVSHHNTIFWKVGEEKKAAEKLCATIRNTVL